MRSDSFYERGWQRLHSSKMVKLSYSCVGKGFLLYRLFTSSRGSWGRALGGSPRDTSERREQGQEQLVQHQGGIPIEGWACRQGCGGRGHPRHSMGSSGTQLGAHLLGTPWPGLPPARRRKRTFFRTFLVCVCVYPLKFAACVDSFIIVDFLSTC